ncbi:hypothetical protein HSB1_02380 [Halogranum salarium B-1]|uniref:Uncharacterized protein n=1 Tax=Halogranum salarium B-1 TaxID=1210908 RepID=J3EZV6_9EURY|nr:hypothetical protein HSB1_02380 [Halogranum salarium B-1]
MVCERPHRSLFSPSPIRRHHVIDRPHSDARRRLSDTESAVVRDTDADHVVLHRDRGANVEGTAVGHETRDATGPSRPLYRRVGSYRTHWRTVATGVPAGEL